jgi:dCMP deaminase
MRPDKDTYFLRMAFLCSERSTCPRRKVGCVLVNERGHVLATGYNGVPAGFKHCIDSPCPGANAEPGQGLEKCEAIHAEQNALLQCKNVYDIHTAYCTDSPCVTCVKLLLNTSCKRIVFMRRYPHAASEELWTRAGRDWDQRNITRPLEIY